MRQRPLDDPLGMTHITGNQGGHHRIFGYGDVEQFLAARYIGPAVSPSGAYQTLCRSGYP